jgi:hypothetical protein
VDCIIDNGGRTTGKTFLMFSLFSIKYTAPLVLFTFSWLTALYYCISCCSSTIFRRIFWSSQQRPTSVEAWPHSKSGSWWKMDYHTIWPSGVINCHSKSWYSNNTLIGLLSNYKLYFFPFNSAGSSGLEDIISERCYSVISV